jgi:hypothetical protein
MAPATTGRQTGVAASFFSHLRESLVLVLTGAAVPTPFGGATGAFGERSGGIGSQGGRLISPRGVGPGQLRRGQGVGRCRPCRLADGDSGHAQRFDGFEFRGGGTGAVEGCPRFLPSTRHQGAAAMRSRRLPLTGRKGRRRNGRVAGDRGQKRLSPKPTSTARGRGRCRTRPPLPRWRLCSWLAPMGWPSTSGSTWRVPTRRERGSTWRRGTGPSTALAPARRWRAGPPGAGNGPNASPSRRRWWGPAERGRAAAGHRWGRRRGGC